jgi:hypothetical protein
VVNVALLGIGADEPPDDHRMAGLEVADAKTPADKAERLADRVPTPLQVVEQVGQLKNPDAAVGFDTKTGVIRLENFAKATEGLSTGDLSQYVRCYWEIAGRDKRWDNFQGTAIATTPYGGRETIIFWDNGKGSIRNQPSYRIVGQSAWGKQGIVIRQMGELPVSIYTGEMFDDGTAVLIPNHKDLLLPLWCYCESSDFATSVRSVDQSLKVTSSKFTQIPFDLAHWQTVAAEKYPNGLPEPHSDDPTQWLFKGDIATSTDPLQVAVARLLGYRWPDQPIEDAVVDPFVDEDGIVCLPGVRHEPPAAERLADLLRAVGYKTEVDLAAWLRDKFFEEHCKRFHQRPFIWHIWDGRKDGFSALVNYHKLNHKTLENLTYSYLGDWISAQSKSDKAGADLRLAAAQALQEKLKLILAGDPPYDIFVRWKPLHEQAIGWHPELNDGVRMNIRPFIEADILRKTPNIKWTKDRGKEPERDKHDYPWFWSGGEFVGDRVNDVHLTNEKKTAARSRKKGAK